MKYARDRRMSLARLAIGLLVAAFGAIMLRSGSVSDVDAAELSARMAPLARASGLSALDANAFQERFGVSPDGLAAWQLYAAGDSVMDVDELLVAKAVDAEEADRYYLAAQARLAAQKEAFRDYGTDQYDRLERALLWQRGGYLFYAVGRDADAWERQLLTAIR